MSRVLEDPVRLILSLREPSRPRGQYPSHFIVETGLGGRHGYFCSGFSPGRYRTTACASTSAGVNATFFSSPLANIAA